MELEQQKKKERNTHRISCSLFNTIKRNPIKLTNIVHYFICLFFLLRKMKKNTHSNMHLVGESVLLLLLVYGPVHACAYLEYIGEAINFFEKFQFWRTKHKLRDRSVVEVFFLSFSQLTIRQFQAHIFFLHFRTVRCCLLLLLLLVCPRNESN